MQRPPPQSRPKVLLSARDAGAAGHIGAIARELAYRDVTIQLVAEHPALELLRSDGLSAVAATDWLGRDFPIQGPLASASLPRVGAAIAAFDPDAILLGQSQRNEISVDDWILAAAGSVPTAVMQDFWGEVKPVLGRTPDLFLVLDVFAEEVTRAKIAKETVVVGSPKHVSNLALDIVNMRHEGRQSLNFSEHDFVVGYFGQDLSHLEGYRSTVDDVARAVSKLGDAKLLYRPHPRESPNSVLATVESLSRYGVRPSVMDVGRVENAISSVDVLLSCFSNCGYDALYMARSGLLHIPLVIYTDHHPEVKEYWSVHANIDRLPAVTLGAAFEATSGADLERLLRWCRDPESRSSIMANIQRFIPDPAGAAKASVDALLNLVGRAGAHSKHGTSR